MWPLVQWVPARWLGRCSMAAPPHKPRPHPLPPQALQPTTAAGSIPAPATAVGSTLAPATVGSSLAQVGSMTAMTSTTVSGVTMTAMTSTTGSSVTAGELNV